MSCLLFGRKEKGVHMITGSMCTLTYATLVSALQREGHFSNSQLRRRATGETQITDWVLSIQEKWLTYLTTSSNGTNNTSKRTNVGILRVLLGSKDRLHR